MCLLRLSFDFNLLSGLLKNCFDRCYGNQVQNKSIRSKPAFLCRRTGTLPWNHLLWYAVDSMRFGDQTRSGSVTTGFLHHWHPKSNDGAGGENVHLQHLYRFTHHRKSDDTFYWFIDFNGEKDLLIGLLVLLVYRMFYWFMRVFSSVVYEWFYLCIKSYIGLGEVLLLISQREYYCTDYQHDYLFFFFVFLVLLGCGRFYWVFLDFTSDITQKNWIFITHHIGK